MPARCPHCFADHSQSTFQHKRLNYGFPYVHEKTKASQLSPGIFQFVLVRSIRPSFTNYVTITFCCKWFLQLGDMYGNVFFVTLYGNSFSKAFVIILSWLQCMGTAVVNSRLFYCRVLEWRHPVPLHCKGNAIPPTIGFL